MTDARTIYRNARDAYARARAGMATAEDEATIAAAERATSTMARPSAAASPMDLPVARAMWDEADR